MHKFSIIPNSRIENKNRLKSKQHKEIEYEKKWKRD